jgi:hypothetical protein
MPDLIQVHPVECLVPPGGEEIEIDVEMAPLMRRLWSMGLETKGCCQDFGESILHNGHRSTTSDDDRQRFADFYRGQAWLKMPLPDATRLISSISNHPLFEHRLRRWTHPEAWMSIAYIFPNGEGVAEVTKAAQLHFPRVQLPELVEALATTASTAPSVDPNATSRKDPRECSGP